MTMNLMTVSAVAAAVVDGDYCRCCWRGMGVVANVMAQSYCHNSKSSLDAQLILFFCVAISLLTIIVTLTSVLYSDCLIIIIRTQNTHERVFDPPFTAIQRQTTFACCH